MKSSGHEVYVKHSFMPKRYILMYEGRSIYSGTDASPYHIAVRISWKLR